MRTFVYVASSCESKEEEERKKTTIAHQLQAAEEDQRAPSRAAAHLHRVSDKGGGKKNCDDLGWCSNTGTGPAGTDIHRQTREEMKSEITSTPNTQSVPAENAP